MVAVVGCWELGWNTPFMEADLWEYPLKEFGVDSWIMTPVSGIQRPWLKEIHDIDVFIKEQRDLGIPLVFVDEKGKSELSIFEHPKDVVYICGKTSQSLLHQCLPSDMSVKVETTVNGGGFWAHQAVSIVLYDRMKKSWL
jgi:tRNA(Leu) C34 or U34 (ribose-2'-O)-methylase TrmL